MLRIIKFVILDILKNKVIVAYTILLVLFSWSIFSLEDNSTKGILSLLNIILLTVPLVSILFSTIYIYNSAEFIELLLSLPVKRKSIWISLFSGLSISLSLAFLIGTGIPILIYSSIDIASILILMGVIISLVFSALAFMSAVLTRDKAKGIGISIMLWLYFALLFDGLVLFLSFQFSEYPIEKIMVGITALSPIDLVRISILLNLESFTMMGYTGAIFKDFFGTGLGFIITLLVLFLWIVVPFYISLVKFKNKDI